MCVLHLCYWRWSTKLVLQAMEHRVREYSEAQPLARAQIWREVWEQMESKMETVQVVARSDRGELEVMDRKDVKRAREGVAAEVRAHHPSMNPSSRRTGAQQFSVLVGSLADGSLWRAGQQIARDIERTPSHSAVIDAMRVHKVTLWSQRNSYSCVRLARWLIQAEGVEVAWSEEEWGVLCSMGEGVKAGLEQCGLSCYAGAVRLCELISSAYGEPYRLDSLASFLCFGSRSSSFSSFELQWPERARPVTIAGDLEIECASLNTSQPLARRTEMSQKPTQRSSIATPIYHRLLCMRPLIECLDMKSHFALRRCGRCTCLAWVGPHWQPQPLAREELLHYWVARFLHIDGPRAIELQRHGMSKGCVTRVLACAQDWLDGLDRAVLRSLWRDAFLGALVVVRIAFKFEVPDWLSTEALGVYRSAGQNRGRFWKWSIG